MQAFKMIKTCSAACCLQIKKATCKKKKMCCECLLSQLLPPETPLSQTKQFKQFGAVLSIIDGSKQMVELLKVPKHIHSISTSENSFSETQKTMSLLIKAIITLVKKF